jgi:DNA polymerase III subunit gamma/tau
VQLHLHLVPGDHQKERLSTSDKRPETATTHLRITPIHSPGVPDLPVQTSLYRRHRPQSFAQVVGQEPVVRTLSNAIERDRVHHAYLFVGSRGTGKTSIAKILARSLNCVNGPTLEPCGKCEACVSIAAGTSLDVIEMDAASNRSVDDIRELRDRVGFAPAAGKWKVYILDEAHMLTREAWNAFLKTLEEPPPSTVFVLATTEAHKVMPTIVDRCQRFDFARPAPAQIAEVIRRVAAAEEIEIDDGAIAAVARSATGSFRDALGTLDQLVAYGGKRIDTDDVLAVLGVADATLILAAADAIAEGNGRATLEASEGLARSGRDVAQFGRDLLPSPPASDHPRRWRRFRRFAPGCGSRAHAGASRLVHRLGVDACDRFDLGGADRDPRGRRAADDHGASTTSRRPPPT